MSEINVTIAGSSAPSATIGAGQSISVSTGLVSAALPQLQIAAGNGIDIVNSAGVSTISANLSELAIPNGTSVNGLTGSVSLVAGDGITVTESGQNITLDAYNEYNILPRDLTLVQTFDGQQHFSWTREHGYRGSYIVEIAEVGVTQDVSGQNGFSVAADGSVNLSLDLDATYIGALAVEASTSESGDYELLEVGLMSGGEEGLDASKIYLPESFNSTGTYWFRASLFDVAGAPVAATGTTQLTLQQHGHPLPPSVQEISASGNGTINAVVKSYQSPHERGFFNLSDMTYYLEGTTDETFESAWIRGAALNSPSETDILSLNMTVNGTVYFRVVAENPLGEGEPSEPI